MNCPDWAELIRARRAPRRDGEAWRRAMAHLDSCTGCRRQALVEDPLLVFRRVGASPGDAPGPTDAEIRSICREVRAVARSRSAEQRRRPAPWPRVAAAALFVAAMLMLGGDAPESQSAERSVADRGRVAASTVRPAAGPTDLPAVSLVEDLDRPGARVYEWRRQGVSVVMIVDAALDV